ncbi:uncharacterized protein N0V89_001951 [Didymosphaeria variabile]|uniref:NAD(P)-binding protein n=1 Tax=Didymosphaeria variabile TaxID=1932322 RepID=A0A9W8XR82_9PLEO|nr:uncharacterized protein N0V89_001951 [Didymosphaeria variabile]KAJ4357376.1 hypothetical protein N0V89_001951 [Didymosphaeria variabile]
MERNVVITGASSGLGLAFLKHYAAQHSTRVIALDISPLPTDVSSLENVSSYNADVTSEESLEKVSADLNGLPIHILIHSAGIRGLVPSVLAEKRDVAAAETLQVMDRTTFMRTLEINTWGAFATVRTFIPNLQSVVSHEPAATPPKVIIMSSRMGSIFTNISGGGYAYRASKAALNAVVKSLSVDVEGVVVLAMHPGRVETGLVGWKEEGAISAEESLRTCLPVIERVELIDSGFFLDRFGEGIRW